jgi:hypothetical protein
VKRFILLAVALTACKWTDFDDLSDQTWVRSQEKPSIGSTDYALVIAGASSGTDGGTVSVVSTDSPTYSTIQYDAKGGSKVGDNALKLGQHFIVSLSEKPILVGDGAGNVALVEHAIDAGQIAVVSGPAATPVDLTFAGQPPSAAIWGGGKLFIAAPTTAVGMANLFVVDGTMNMPSCALTDETGMPLQAAAIATTATRLWVWSKTGSVMGYDLTGLVAGCTTVGKATAAFTQSFAPGSGARIHIVSDGAKEWAILAAHADKATNGEVVVLDLTVADAVTPPAQVGTTLSVDGLLSSTVAVFDTKTYLVLGIPSAQVGSTPAGQVAIHEVDTTTGMVADAPAEVLNDAQPESGQLFGRDVTTMQYNGHTILVVAASNEVFAYYRTSLYADTRNPPPTP